MWKLWPPSPIKISHYATVHWYGRMEWNMEKNFSMEWKIFSMEWKKF